MTYDIKYRRHSAKRRWLLSPNTAQRRPKRFIYFYPLAGIYLNNTNYSNKIASARSLPATGENHVRYLIGWDNYILIPLFCKL